MKRIVVIGASIAGHTAVTVLREINKDLKLTLVTEEECPLYDKRQLLDLLAGRVKEKEIFLSSFEFYQSQAIEFLKETKVVAINTQKQVIYCKNKGPIEYDFLVICSGQRSLLPDIPGVKKDGVYSLNSLIEYKQFSRHLLGTQGACLAGSGKELANIAKAIFPKLKELKIITLNGPGLSEILPTAETELEIINSRITEIIGESEVQAVKLSEGKIIGTSSVVFVGDCKNNIDFLKNSHIEMDQDAILVDEKMCTNIKNIFASGTVCRKRQEQEPQAARKTWEEVASESKNLAAALDCLLKV